MSPLVFQYFNEKGPTQYFDDGVSDLGRNTDGYLVFTIKTRIKTTEDPDGLMPMPPEENLFVSDFHLKPNDWFNYHPFELHEKGVINHGSDFIDLYFAYFKTSR